MHFLRRSHLCVSHDRASRLGGTRSEVCGVDNVADEMYISGPGLQSVSIRKIFGSGLDIRLTMS